VIYLLLLYTLTSAYMVGSSQILSEFLNPFIPFTVPNWCWPIVVFLVFGTFVYFGTESVDFFNRVLMIVLVLLYLSVVGFGLFHIEPPKLAYFDWNYLLPSISVVLTTFGYHIIIPTLTTYLEHDTKRLKQAIVIGSLIPFLIYIFWQLLVMGVMPVTGDLSLSEAATQGRQVTLFLAQLLNSAWIGIAVRLFAFCAIVTSLLGVSLSLADFLSDGLKVKKTHLGKLCLILLTFVPPLLFTLFYPEGFLIAINYAGIFVVILLAFLPTLMAWFERYGPETERSLIKSDYTVKGGKFGVIATLMLSLVLLGIEVFL